MAAQRSRPFRAVEAATKMVVTAADTDSGERHPSPHSQGGTLTVAVCTRDRTAQLRRLLDALSAQCAPRVDVLVVDNAPSTSDTERMVRELFPGYGYVREPLPGLDFARNRAVHDAMGEIVAFIDDDAVPAGDWIETIRNVFAESERIAVCTGQVSAMSLGSEGERLFEASGGMRRGDTRIHLPPGAGRWPPRGPRPLITWATGAGVGCSLAIRRQVARAIGGFDVALDQGPPLSGGGDIDMLWRVLSAGYEVVYEPRVRVWHEHRREPGAAECQILGHDRAFMAALAKAFRAAPLRDKPGILAFIVWRLLKPLGYLAASLVHAGPLPTRTLARRVVHTWRGLVAYRAARRLALAKMAGSQFPENGSEPIS
jgi:GT2 family glycosyltransferase